MSGAHKAEVAPPPCTRRTGGPSPVDRTRVRTGGVRRSRNRTSTSSPYRSISRRSDSVRPVSRMSPSTEGPVSAPGPTRSRQRAPAASPRSRDLAGVARDLEDLPVREELGGPRQPDHRGDAELPGQPGGVLEQPAILD